MISQDYKINGQPLLLDKRIGRGGEGEVFLINGKAGIAAKIYKPELAAAREGKVMAMVHSKLADTTSLVAYPREVIRLKSGAFAGFTMNVVDGHKPLHEVTGPKSRRQFFPKADFRFLLRTAANTARAFHQIHQSCVIGDVNPSGVLISNQATVVVIDADSFQYSFRGQQYSCLVGTPDFTPPELQGKTLTNVTRTLSHDNFGLAVMIFQLLFMDRHPYAGRSSKGDLSLEESISKNLFAYSKRFANGVVPPAFVATLEDFPDAISEAFERAFGPNPVHRPNAVEWISALTSLEKQLSRCSANPVHFYPSHSKTCPWCKMENATGGRAILFLAPINLGGTAEQSMPSFDLDKVWAYISSIDLPTLDYVPALTSLANNMQPSGNARSDKVGTWSGKLWGCILICGGVTALFVAPAFFFIWLMIVFYGWANLKSSPSYTNKWQVNFTAADRSYQTALRDWQDSTGISRLHDIKANLEVAADEYKKLPLAKSQALSKLQTDRQNRQKHEYLDRILLRNSSISGIGRGKLAVLASHGIESADDLDTSAIIRISGFGSATAQKLMAWRALHERRFVYNPSPNSSDAQATARVISEYQAKALKLINQLNSGATELKYALASTQARLNHPDSTLSQSWQELQQAECDLKFLNVTLPARIILQRPQPSPHLARNAATPLAGQAITSGNTVLCPSCGSHMIKRTARRGRNRGNTFWGCSKYPMCTGTRP